MTRFLSSAVIVAIAVVTGTEECVAFPISSAPQRSSAPSALSMRKESSSMGRREVMSGFAAAFAASIGSTVAPESASAKYSDYARREKDWEERVKTGEVKVSSARDLRAQLQEIAPMNSSGSKIFCPNGPSSNVSPLMENKCGDRLATPSVYGRTNDSMGNSIPGFASGYDWTAGSSSVSAAAGGFPTYKENEWKIREYGK